MQTLRAIFVSTLVVLFSTVAHSWPGGLRINEFMASNASTLLDEDGAPSDWIEIYNDSDRSVNLAGWSLTDDEGNLQKWIFPTVSLAAGDYLVVFASSKDRTNPASELHTNFKLSSEGEYLALVQPDSTVVSSFDPYPAQMSDISYGPINRPPDLLRQGAPAAVNSPLSLAEFNADYMGWNTVEFTGAVQSAPVSMTWKSSNVWNNNDGSSDDQHKLSHGYLDDYDTGDGYGVNINISGIPFETYRVYGLLASDSGGGVAMQFVDFNVNGEWAFGGSLPSEAAVYGTINDNNAYNGEFWTEIIPGSVIGNYWTVETSGSTCSVGGQIHTGSSRGSLTAIIIEPTGASDGSVISIDFASYDAFSGGQNIGPLSTDSSNWYSSLWHDSGTVVDGSMTFEIITSNWQSGHTGIGYDTGGIYDSLIGLGGDIESLAYTQNASAFIRIPFVASLTNMTQLTLRMKYDDGFRAFINGTPVAEDAAPSAAGWNSAATSERNAALNEQWTLFDLTPHIPLLNQGDNILAIQGFNRTASSPDLLILPELDAVYPNTGSLANRYFYITTPGTANKLGYADFVTDPVLFSHANGMVIDSFELSMSSTNVGGVIRYTTDGSDPIDASPEYTAPLSVSGSTQVRARIFEPGKAPGPATFGSYVFLAPDVQAFSSALPILVIENFGGGTIPGKGWNQTGAGIVQVPRQEAMLYLCDKPLDGNALLSQPDKILPMGIRERGAYSSSFVHKPYSVELWDEEGNQTDAKLLGMPSESDWILYWPNPETDTTLIKNTFIYELSNQVGHYAARTRFVQIFINEDGGDLTMADRVGVYVLLEKVKRDKNRLDFDELSADGTQGGWLLGINRMDAIPESGVGSPQYFHTAGADRIQSTPPNSSGQGDDEPQQYNAFLNFDEPNGYKINPVQRAAIEEWFVPFEDALWGPDFSDPVLGYERYLDSDDFIDYFQLHNITKNGDGLLISMWTYKESPEGKLKMGPVWDYDLGGYGGGATDSLFHRSDRLWYGRLFQDPDFYQRYIDRWQAHREDIYADTNMFAIIDAQAAEITDPIAAFHGISSWASRLSGMKSWLSTRCAAIDNQFLAMPVFNQQGGVITPGLSLSISAPGGGSIYYTLDGSDPRADGGAIAAGAQLYTGSIMLSETTLVRARANNGSSWSGIPEELFVVDLPTLAITEVMYHARDPEGPETNLFYTARDYDFIEIQNRGAAPARLWGVQFSNGVEFDFTHSDITLLAPGEHAVVVGSLGAFTNRYPNASSMNIAGVYRGELDNDGEGIWLTGPYGQTHANLTYADGRGWPLSTDGAGHALVPLSFENQVGGALDYGGNWRAGTYRDGSPAEADPAPVATVVLNEFAAHTDNANPSFPHDSDDWIELFNIAVSSQNLSGWYLSDTADNLKKWAVPGNTLTSGGWISFSETDGFNNPLGSGFGLNKAGEQIFLSYLPGTAQDRVADAVVFKGQENGATLGRYPDGGTYWQATVPSRDAANVLATQDIVISEIMYHPLPTVQNPVDNTADEYIVIHNPTTSPVNLFNASGAWRLDGDADFAFAGEPSLAAGEYVLIVPFNPTNSALLLAFQKVYGLSNGDVEIQGPYSGKLSNRTGKIALERPQAPDIPGQTISWVIVDEVIYGDSLPWPAGPDGTGLALHRLNPSQSGNAPGNWEQGAPSPATSAIILDSDGDGVSDQWELDHSGSITGCVAGAQTGDGDALTYLEEFLLDFDPAVSNAPFEIQDIQMNPLAQIIFGTTSSQRSYTIEYSTNLLEGIGWMVLQTDIPGSNGTTSITDPAINAVRYYRVRVP